MAENTGVVCMCTVCVFYISICLKFSLFLTLTEFFTKHIIPEALYIEKTKLLLHTFRVI